MKLLITGSKGFIGKNLIAELKNNKDTEILEYDRDTNPSLLEAYCKQADFIYHLAGINRPKGEEEFREGNYGFTKTLTELLKKDHRHCPLLYSSTIQAALDNPYGRSKRDAEECLFRYSKETGAKVLIYRLPNVFGKWCRPDYNSVIATFCHNTARNLPLQIDTPDRILNLAYIDDVIRELVQALKGKETGRGDYCEIPVTYQIPLKDIAALLSCFHNSREDKKVPDLSDSFTKKLYSTYLSYLPKEEFRYELTIHEDQRGSFTEFLKSSSFGQVSVNVIKPGIVKGNHWHHTKTEKFLVVKGQGVIRLRELNTDRILEYPVTGDRFDVIDIPSGYTHNIENLGTFDMITLIWANECFEPDRPDTYYEQV